MKTERLYDKDPMLMEFEAAVEAVKPCALPSGGQGLSVRLSATAFFPEAGGQSADRGTLGGWVVEDVSIDEEGVITHYCKSPRADLAPLSAGETARGLIDGPRRLSFMRHHSGEHLFSGLVCRDFGYANVGFHLSDHICTMDYDGPLTEAEVARLEREANEIIQEDRPIRSYYPDDLSRFDYRCKGELSPPIRLVEIEGADLCACCAPHVPSTGMIGLFKVVSAKAYKGGTRLEILCGMKAYEEYTRRSDLLLSAAGLLSTHYGELEERLKALRQELLSCRQRILSLEGALLEESAKCLPADSPDALLFVEAAEDRAARDVVNAQIALREGLCGVFIGGDKEGYRFILASASLDMKKTAECLRQSLGGKCGGSSTMIQGRLSASREAILDLLHSM